MAPSLPSLRALVAFEAATRHMSFTRAARELNVQQPAVSRQIALLEDALGTQLFTRTRPRLGLTTNGERLAAAVSHGLGHISRVTDQIRREHAGRALVVDVTIGFASCWLLARMADFRASHPEIEVQITTRDANLTFDVERSDVIVFFSEGNETGYEMTPVFGETMFPVCAAHHPAARRQPTAAAILEERLLYLRAPYHEDDWTRLLEPFGLVSPPPHAGAEFNSYIVYLQAILNGDGIGIGWAHLLDDLLDVGRLVRIEGISRQTPRGYVCATSAAREPRPEARTFIEWLAGRCQRSAS